MVNLGSTIRTAPSDSYSKVVLVKPWDLRNDYPWGNSSHKLKHATETPRLRVPMSPQVSSPPPLLPKSQMLVVAIVYPRGTSTNGTQGLCSFIVQQGN